MSAQETPENQLDAVSRAGLVVLKEDCWTVRDLGYEWTWNSSVGWVMIVHGCTGSAEKPWDFCRHGCFRCPRVWTKGVRDVSDKSFGHCQCTTSYIVKNRVKLSGSRFSTTGAARHAIRQNTTYASCASNRGYRLTQRMRVFRHGAPKFCERIIFMSVTWWRILKMNDWSDMQYVSCRRGQTQRF